MSRKNQPSGKFKKPVRVPLPPIDEHQLYPVHLFEQYVDCCHAMAYKLFNSGLVKTVKMGRRRLVPGSEIIALPGRLAALPQKEVA